MSYLAAIVVVHSTDVKSCRPRKAIAITTTVLNDTENTA